MFKIVIIVFIALLSTDNATKAQSKSKQRNDLETEYSLNIRKVREAKVIVYYGVDFSLGTLTEPNKFYDSDLILRTYIPNWITFVNTRFPDDWWKRRFFKSKTFKSDLGVVQSDFNFINPTVFVTDSRNDLTIEQISARVKEYALEEESGVGFVFIHESFNKSELYGSGFFVFFDIKTRDVCYAIRLAGRPNERYSVIRMWEHSIIGIFYKFIKRSRTIVN